MLIIFTLVINLWTAFENLANHCTSLLEYRLLVIAEDELAVSMTLNNTLQVDFKTTVLNKITNNILINWLSSSINQQRC